MALTKVQELRLNAELYEALLNEKDDQVIDLCRKIAKGPFHTLTIHGDTVLHMATYHTRTKLTLKLLDMVNPCDYHKLTVQNNGGNTILHETSTNSRTVEVAAEILRRAPMLLNMTNKEGETALFYAARHGKTEIFRFLHEEVSRTTECHGSKSFLRRDDKFTLLHIAILSRNYWIAYQIAITYSELVIAKDADEMTPLQLLSTIKPELRPKSVFKRIMFKIIDASPKVKGRTLEFIKDLKKEKHACEWALKLAQLLISNDNSWQKTESWTDKRGSKVHEYGKTTSALKHEQKIAIAQEANIDQKPDTPLLLAIKHDCPEIVEEILKVYPQAVEHVDKEGHNILHLAILHRRLAIIDMMENMEYPLQRLRGRLDKKYNTLLHMVGLKANDLEDEVKDPAKQLKDDHRLYKRVAKISTTVDLMTRNSDMKTPQEVFFETNDKLREEAKRWMSDNAKNCSIVAILIATVAFTSAYQIPGGNNNGHPVLKGKPMFLLFALADAVSLSSAFTSVIIFLNIVTSPFRFKDFESSLYEKQLAALILLIISVAMMMVAFAATLVLTVSNNATWTNLTLYFVSFFPVFVFVYEYIQVYSKRFVDFWSMLKNMKVKVVLMFHEIWDYKPQSLHSVSGFVHLPTGSPV